MPRQRQKQSDDASHTSVVKTLLKLVLMVTLVTGYWLIGGFEQLPSVWPLVWAMLFSAGIVTTLWLGNKNVGELRPISLRPFYIIGGTILMLWAVFMMLTTRNILGKPGRQKKPAAIHKIP